MARAPVVLALLAATLLAPATASAAYRDFRSPSGRHRCTSRRSGITGTSRRSGHGFTVSVEKQRVF